MSEYNWSKFLLESIFNVCVSHFLKQLINLNFKTLPNGSLFPLLLSSLISIIIRPSFSFSAAAAAHFLQSVESFRFLHPKTHSSYIYFFFWTKQQFQLVLFPDRKMVESELKYEQMRKRRLEENKKRMEELNLKNLSRALKNGSPNPKSSPVSLFEPTIYLYNLYPRIF